MSFILNTLDLALLEIALEEDLSSYFIDLTTDCLFKKSPKMYQTMIVSKEKFPVIICGLPVIKALLQQFKEQFKKAHHKDCDFSIETKYQDGDVLNQNDTLCTLSGDAVLLLAAERTLLNFLRHLSAIATLTHTFVDRVKNTSLKILDTRKTTPGLRHLEKYAIHSGGGVNHRLGLYDAYMIKDTHIDLIGGLEKALDLLPLKKENRYPVIVEIRNQKELDIALQKGQKKITRVLLDNMSEKELTLSVKKCQGIFETEASGNITLEHIQKIAQTGVQYASIGRLTYAAGQVDLAMIGKI